MDLGQEKMLSGVVIQGGKHRDRNVYMKRFKVGHSLDGEDWTLIKEENTTRTKVGSLTQTFIFMKDHSVIKKNNKIGPFKVHIKNKRQFNCF